MTAAPTQPLSPEAVALVSEPRNLAFARQLAAVASTKRGIPADVAESAAILGLCQAAAHYDPSSGVRFLTYASRRILGQIADDAREWRPGKRRPIDATFVSIHAPTGTQSEEQGEVADFIASGDNPIGWGEEAVDAFESLIRELPSQYKQAMRLIYLDCSAGSQAQAAIALGLSDSRLSQLHKGAIAMIRERFATNGHTEGSIEIPAHVPPTSTTPEKRKSRYRGVQWQATTQMWQVVVCGNGKVDYIGRYPEDQEDEAARAYDRAAVAKLGEKARLNFPGEIPAPVASPREDSSSTPVPSFKQTSKSRRPVVANPTVEALIDPEVAAIGALADTLASLDHDAIRRVLGWAASRFGVSFNANANA